jgi:hypothetical protein
VALVSSVVVLIAGSILAEVVLMCVIYPGSVCCDLPSLITLERAFLTLRSHLHRTEGLLWRSLFKEMLQ